MNEKTRRLWPSALVVSLFVVCTIAQFWPALSGAQSISKVNMLAEWDSLFADQKTGQSMLMDPSLVYLMVPYYLFKAGLLHGGTLPLWNPYSGLGCPLVADPQTLAFSPLHLLLILNPGLTAYNQALVLELIILGLSTFALARSLKLSVFASAFAMVSFAFCPYMRWFFEMLGNGYCFVPLVFWLILELRSKVTPVKVWLTGFGCAVMVVSSHPELTVCSISLASLCLMLYVLSDRDNLEASGPDSQDEQERAKRARTSYNGRLRAACLGLAAAGLLAFMLAGPMLLPFLEYLGNSDSYKFGSGAPAVVHWQTFVFNLLQPGYGGASPTLGPCALLLIPLAFCTQRKNSTLVAVLAGMIIFCLALLAKVYPVSEILCHRPFSYIVVNYAFSSAILLTALLAAFGLDSALSFLGGQSAGAEGDLADANARSNSKTIGQKKIGFAAVSFSIALAIAVAAFPPAAKAMHIHLTSANFDYSLPDYAFNRNDVLRYSIFALLGAASLLALKLKPAKTTAIFLLAMVFLGQTAEIITAAKSIPGRPFFAYQEKVVVPALKASTEGGTQRFIAMGGHLFRPNSNVVFGLSDLRTHNPLFPKRYLNYVTACGARLDPFNQEFDGPLSPLLALGSVHSVLSQTPVISQREFTANANGPYQPLVVQTALGVNASFTPLILDRQKQAIFGNLALKSTSPKTADFSYNLAIYDASGHVVWFSDTHSLAGDLAVTKFVAIPTPVPEPGKTLTLGLQIYDNKTGRWLQASPDNGGKSGLKEAFVLGTIDFGNTEVNAMAADYKLVFESPLHMRIYESEKALPRAYAVHQSRTAASDEAALVAIKAPSFEPRKTVLITAESRVRGESLSTNNGDSGISADKRADAVKIAAITGNKVIIDADMGRPGWVVLNDIYYPGWQAQVDATPTEILRANYLMRAVSVPAGKHRIVYSYKPASFAFGLTLLIAALIIGFALAIRTCALAQPSTNHPDGRPK